MPAPVIDGRESIVAGTLSESSDAPTGARAWWKHGMRFVRNAAVGLLVIASIPLGVITMRGDNLLRTNTVVHTRLAEVERLRPLMIAKDLSITPMAAGELLHSLNRVKEVEGLPLRTVAAAAARPWDELSLSDDMFTTLRADGSEGTMAAGIVSASAAGFSDKELAYLRSVAEAPIWRDVERVASAPAVDVIGGRYVLPFRGDASVHAMPIMRFNDTKRLAYAGVARAAYFAAIGQPARAEGALKTVVSYGFALVDNGSHLMDALIGRVIIGIGQNGLHQLYTLTGNNAGTTLTQPFTNGPGRDGVVQGVETDAEAEWARLLRDAGDPQRPRTIRLEALHQLSYASCGNVRGVLLGHSPAVVDAFAKARGDLARYPSERAYLDLMSGTVDRLPHEAWSGGFADRVIMGAATATSVVLGNPRVATCTRIVMAND